MSNEVLPFATRIWFAWLCFFKVLFDGRFAERAWGVRNVLPAPRESGAKAASSAHDTPEAAAKEAPPREVAPKAESIPAPSFAPKADPMLSALQLLALLQREGRLVDFLQQDIASFGDADVGVAARVVHEGCRRALRAHAQVEPIRAEAEGARLTLPAGFDADAVKLVGEVRGQPPYHGVLRHRGWRASKLELPRVVGAHDERVLAPAELEIE